MTYYHEIEYTLPNGEYEYTEVKFECSISTENDGIGPYEYWGAKGFDKGQDYAVLDDTPTYDEKCHTEAENETIRAFLKDDVKYKKFEEEICRQAEEERSEYFNKPD